MQTSKKETVKIILSIIRGFDEGYYERVVVDPAVEKGTNFGWLSGQLVLSEYEIRRAVTS